MKYVIRCCLLLLAVVAGNSLGGYVAWSTALFYPERVDKLVLVDASGYPFKSKSKPIAFHIYNSPILKFLFGGIMPRAVVKSSIETSMVIQIKLAQI